MSKPPISYSCAVVSGQFSLKNEERDGVNVQKNPNQTQKAKVCLNLESYLNKALALEFLQFIRDSLLEKNQNQTPTTQPQTKTQVWYENNA